VTSEKLALQASGTITACLVVAVLAVIVSDVAARWVPVPTVVLEILGGILVGPAVFGFAHDNVIVSAFSQLGLTVLMFLAGYEIQMSRVAGAPLRSACLGWAGSLVLGITAGIVVVTVARPEEGVSAGVLVGLIFTTTALGTVLPILRDTGELDTPFGTFILAAGALGEFGPILAMAVLLSGESAIHTIVVLVLFVGIAAAVLAAASRPASPRIARLMQNTLTTSGQLGVRVAMLLVIFLAWVAGHLGLDVLLGAFTAGLVARLFFSGTDEETQEATMARLEGVGFGFLVPIFFVVSGIRFDLDSLLSAPSALILIPVALVLFLLIRGVPTYLALHGALAGRDRLGAGIYAATALPLVVVITSLGVEDGRLTEATAAALVGAGMLSVLLFPLTATRVRGVTRPVTGARWSDDSDLL
jgi:Kef-type K+ transport system membrane component KefB